MKITFADKVSTIISSLPVINRIRAEDINEIKNKVDDIWQELRSIRLALRSISQ